MPRKLFIYKHLIRSGTRFQAAKHRPGEVGGLGPVFVGPEVRHPASQQGSNARVGQASAEGRVGMIDHGTGQRQRLFQQIEIVGHRPEGGEKSHGEGGNRGCLQRQTHLATVPADVIAKQAGHEVENADLNAFPVASLAFAIHRQLCEQGIEAAGITDDDQTQRVVTDKGRYYRDQLGPNLVVVLAADGAVISQAINDRVNPVAGRRIESGLTVAFAFAFAVAFAFAFATSVSSNCLGVGGLGGGVLLEDRGQAVGGRRTNGFRRTGGNAGVNRVPSACPGNGEVGERDSTHNSRGKRANKKITHTQHEFFQTKQAPCVPGTFLKLALLSIDSM